MSDVAISDMADVNPPARIPKGLIGESAVSFIPMTDVSESGCWTFKQSRPLKSVTAGFTAFEEGDVLVAKITPCLENGKGAHAVGLENGIGFGSTEFHVLRARMGNEPRFVFHLSQWRRFRRAAESQMVGSAGQQRVPRAFFDGFRVSEFSAVQQARIAQILDTLDTAIHETEAIIAKLKAVKQGLLHDLLTRGIDANGELRPPQSEAPHLYKPSPLGWIPKEWEEISLGDIARRSGGHLQTGPFGSQLHANEYTVEGIPVVMPQDMIDGEVSVEHIARITERRASALARHRLKPNDVVFSRRGDLSRCVAIDERQAGWVCGTGCLLARLPASEVNAHWLALVYQQPVTQSQVMGRAVGSTMANLNTSILAAISIARPTVTEQNVIAKRIVSTSLRIRTEERTLQKLRLEKAGLMDDLLTGRVRVTPLLTTTQGSS
jgi:type I restriction enzyme S subunit